MNLSLTMLQKNSLYGSDSERTGPPLVSFDFSALPEDARQTLKNDGFQLEKAMTDPAKIGLTGNGSGLSIETSGPAFGLLVNKEIEATPAEWVEIVWGIDKYPDMADWSKGKNREAIMVYVFFGESVAADKFYLPDSPYFIGLFLGQNEPPLTPYTGKSYQKTGRYVCLGNPETGQVTTSRYNIGKSFRELFGKQELPPVTGIAIEVDTQKLPDGLSSAFIESISLLGAET